MLEIKVQFESLVLGHPEFLEHVPFEDLRELFHKEFFHVSGNGRFKVHIGRVLHECVICLAFARERRLEAVQALYRVDVEEILGIQVPRKGTGHEVFNLGFRFHGNGC